MAWSGVYFANMAAWEGFPWGTTAFFQQFIDAMSMRAASVAELAASTPADPDPLEDGFPITAANINAMRNWVSWVVNPAGDTTNGTTLEANWWDPVHFANGTGSGQSSPPGDPFRSGGEWTGEFLDRINAILAAQGLDEMDSTLVGGTDLPWTRKYGDPSSPTVAYGDMQEGDIIGPWLFNEWRAFIEALEAIFISKDAAGSDDHDGGVGDVGELASCDETKDAIKAIYGPPGDGPGNIGGMIGHLYTSTGSGEDFNGFFSREWTRFGIFLPTVTSATARYWIVPTGVGGFDFFLFSHSFLYEDQISLLTTHAADGSYVTYDPAPDNGCEIDELGCPSGIDDHVTGGFRYDNVFLAIVMTYPDP